MSLFITFSLFKMSCAPIIDGVETDFCKGSLACNKHVSTARFVIVLLKPFYNTSNNKIKQIRNIKKHYIYIIMEIGYFHKEKCIQF